MTSTFTGGLSTTPALYVPPVGSELDTEAVIVDSRSPSTMWLSSAETVIVAAVVQFAWVKLRMPEESCSRGSSLESETVTVSAAAGAFRGWVGCDAAKVPHA